MTIGVRITQPNYIDPGIVDRFRSMPVANISDSMSRMRAGGRCSIGPRLGSMRMTIPAPQLLPHRYDLGAFVPSW
jgi:hypothetical protein